MSKLDRRLQMLITLVFVGLFVSHQPLAAEESQNIPGVLRATYDGHTDRVLCVAISPDGKYIASGGVDKSVRIWDTLKGKQSHSFAHTSPICSLSFSIDGEKLATGDAAGLVMQWDVEAGTVMNTLKGIAGPVLQVAYTESGKMLAAAGLTFGIVWDLETGKPKKNFERSVQPATGPMSVRFAISPDERTLAWTSIDGVVLFWDLTTNSPTSCGAVEGHQEGINALTYSPDGRILATGGFAGGINGNGKDKSIKLWSTENGQELVKLVGHNKGIYSLTFAPNGKTLIAADCDGDMKHWDLNTSHAKATLSQIQRENRIAGTPIGPWAIGSDMKTWAVGAGKSVLWLDISDFSAAND